MKQQLLNAVANVLEHESESIRRVEIPVKDINPLAWLGAQTEPIKGYWSDRDGHLEIAAIGEADLLKGKKHSSSDVFFEQVAERLCHSDDGVRYYGGFRFSTETEIGTLWNAFSTYRFILPRIEVIRQGNETRIGCNVLSGKEHADALARLIETMQFPTQLAIQTLPTPRRRQDKPTQKDWNKNVRHALDEIENGSLQKLVLARRSIFEFSEPLNPFALLYRLKQGTPGCYHFCGNHGDQVAFIGATPERLYYRKGRHVMTEALAGTRARGMSAVADDQLGEELLRSDKDLNEHAIVRDKIHDGLLSLCHSVRVQSEPGLMKLSNVQHLVSEITGELKQDVSDAKLLKSLHPTPAVGGYPRERALKELSKLESFDRGWYAGPVGWIGKDEAEFVVAIRCGLIGGSHLALFSGAGIVKGSKPDEEWNEVENKISNFVNILTVS